MKYTNDELAFAKAYYNYHNGEIHADYEDYQEYKAVCQAIKEEHGFRTWQEVNNFLKEKKDVKALIKKYSKGR
jgi:spore coat polysaccharide biosynthesis protein SpsF (cytidylyltransferase family)